MRIKDINKEDKLLLSIDDISKNLSISTESARVTANRYLKQGILFRIKRNSYITADKFNTSKENDFFRIANFIQTPSYISLLSALSYYNISTQQLQGIVESVALKRSKSFKVKTREFRYYLVKKGFYYGFLLADIFFIASAEKAFADIIYLSSLSKYDCDFDAIDFSKINKTGVGRFLENTNKKTLGYWESLCSRYNL